MAAIALLVITGTAASSVAPAGAAVGRPSAPADSGETPGARELPRRYDDARAMPSCSCAAWTRSACIEAGDAASECRGVCCSSHRRRSAEYHHRCPVGSYHADAAHETLRTEQRGWHRARRNEDGWLLNGNGGRRFESSGVATWCSADVPKPPQCLFDGRASGGDDIPHGTWPSGRVGQPLRSVHGGQVELIHNYKVRNL